MSGFKAVPSRSIGKQYDVFLIRHDDTIVGISRVQWDGETDFRETACFITGCIGDVVLTSGLAVFGA